MGKYTDGMVNITFDGNIITFSGEMRFHSLTDYKSIKEYLWNKIPILSKDTTLIINIESLEQLNSSGQAILNMFLLELKRHSIGISINV